MSSEGANSTGRYTLSVLPGSRIALYCWSGPITVADRRSVRSELIRFCRENRIHNLIVDGREQQSGTGTLDAFRFGEEVPDFFRGVRIAVVHRSDDDLLPFIVTVASNRGSTMRSFLSIEAAQSWLESLKDPPSTVHEQFPSPVPNSGAES